MGRNTDCEAFDGFVFWSTAGAVGTTDEFGVSAAMLVSAVVSTMLDFLYERDRGKYLLLTVMVVE